MKEFYFFILLASNFVGIFNEDIEPNDGREIYLPKFLREKYGSSFMSPSYSFSKTKPSGTKSGVKTGVKSYVKTGPQFPSTTIKYHGGCTDEPSPMNAHVRCSKISGCKATCLPNYKFPNGETVLYITCQERVWEVQGSSWDSIPSCEPVCLPACENNGICMAPNQCNCPENFSGPQCQFGNKPCLNYPPIPMNSRRLCRSTTCTINCLPGHQFPDGSAITTMICKDGNWMPSRENWVSVPNCEPTCSPPCENGGNCLSFNVCQCPQNFRGPQCQYSADACGARKLQFNGGYNCSGSGEAFSCSLVCPEGVQFEFPPASVYTCTYVTGIFEPHPIPQCVFGKTIGPIIPMLNGQHPFPNLEQIFTTGNYRPNQPQPNLPTMDPDVEMINVGSSGKNSYFTIEEKLPKPGICFTWGGTHFKTFDGKVFSFVSQCPHTLIRDAIDNTFSVITQNSPACESGSHLCHTIITIYLQKKAYSLKVLDNGVPVLMNERKMLPIPGRLPGMRTEMSAHYIIVYLDTIGAKIKWDGQRLVQVEVTESLWNRTSGLCGKLDGDSGNDLAGKDGSASKSIVTLANSWQVETLGDECSSAPTGEHVCEESHSEKVQKSYEFCKNLFADKRFMTCQKVVDMSMLMDACRWDFCSCKAPNPIECLCTTLNVYAKECFHKGITSMTMWRDENTCPMVCSGGRVYMSCAPKGGQDVCGASVESSQTEDTCEEGCYCAKGTVLHDSKCITKDRCPCRLRGKDFPPGASVPKDCNTCTCSDGQWICTQVACGARCSALGDPHYTTFDGKRYDFMGQCTYYLVKADDFSIEAENVACAGSISLAMNFPVSVSSSLPSCTKSVTIRVAGHVIALKQNHELSVNNREIAKIPYAIAGITIRSVSSIFVVVEFPSGLEVWWDGITRVYVNAPASLRGKTKGLCGTFNDNQKDDFLTMENDVEKSVIAFANKWKTREECNDIPDKLKSHPCDSNMQNRAIAEEHCRKMKTDIFGDCHWHVDPEPFYQNCLYDMCSCEGKMTNCLCPMIAAYAHECAVKGVQIDWRSDVKECGVHCPGGQTYQVCGNSCTRTCYDIASRPNCREQCVEGCNCPKGQTLDEHGECIPMGQCRCQHDGLEFPAGYKEVRPASKGPELCTCTNALWNCRPAVSEETKKYPQAKDLKTMCSSVGNFVFTTCESPEPVTCKNMHSQDMVSASVCHAGCECKEGYVLDTSSKTCVRPTECPCHHGGRSYGEKSIVQSDCNTCTCNGGKWNCTDRQCAAECSAWGDSHFKTFDGKIYDFQGQCDYVLAKGALSSEDTFDVSIQNVPCGSLGVSCSKSVTIKIGSGAQQERISLTRHKKVQDAQIFKRFTVRNKDLFVIVEAADIGVIIHWDKGTRIYIKVDPRWKDKIKGLCGNYNDNEMDDFQNPSGGITEASAMLFGDSWKLQSYCPETEDITDTCEKRPDRKIWALRECGIMKSSTFAPCHSEVVVDSYFEKCVFDSCACDQGGDCECLCTAIAAYAQECNNKGVPIKWRSQELCPIQCDERCSQYSPCVSTCPLETCDNLLIQNPLSKLCKEDSCIEGCEFKPCPPDQVYLNTSFSECIPRNVCKPVCLEVDDVVYYEGDMMKEDACHSCYCSRGKETCKGQPCSTTPKPTPTPASQMDKYVTCKSGWTDWINQDKATPIKTKKSNWKLSEIEPLPNSLIMNNLKGKSKCDVKNIVNIECRTVDDHVSPKETGLDIECSLEKGLYCNGRCKDFEIRVLCKCEEVTTEHTPNYTPCDANNPNSQHAVDCHLFYHCSPNGISGPELVEKTCGPTMMYNPSTQVCDFPHVVSAIRPECLEEESTTSEVGIEIDGELCSPGEIYDSCAISCNQLCAYYSYVVGQTGKCRGGNTCEGSCISAKKNNTCPAGKLWTNEDSCVDSSDCMCTSDNGRPVKPGMTYRESDCKICQCINNFYTCDTSACGQEPTEEETEPTTEIPVVITTVTPPEKCKPDRFINLIQGDRDLPDDAFSASSAQSDAFLPKYSGFKTKTSGKSGGSWKPEVSDDKRQYLQINLGRQEPVYGVIVRGSPLYPEYVTSYLVSYSPDGLERFNFIMDADKRLKVFRGSADQNAPASAIFDEPIEAHILRIHPQTWHNEIALRVELIGCGEVLTSTSPTELPFKTRPTDCEDPMGVGDGTMSDQQISTSSEYSQKNDKTQLKINGEGAWQPITNSPTEWIQFDFLEPRKITGVETQGGPLGWVTTYTVKYSNNKQDWMPVVDDSGEEKVFLGNFDKETPVTITFDIPLSTRYLKIVPTKWTKNIQMRIEPHGCFEPYPDLPVTVPIPKTECNNCPGTESAELDACHCPPALWWDGENCVARTQCPCMVGHIAYPIGTIFGKEDCSECICKLGGVEHCTPKTCQKCDKGLRSVVTNTCGCLCLPCDEGTILCATSNICINASLWCNGVQDCPDDETNCATTVNPISEATEVPVTKTEIEEVFEEKCPSPNCPPGYKVADKKSVSKTQKFRRYLATMFSTFGAKTKTKNSYLALKTAGKKVGVKTGYKTNLDKPVNVEPEKFAVKKECPQFQCVSTKPPPKFEENAETPICPPVECPPGYKPDFDLEKTKEYCPRYECRPPPPPDAICNVTGRTFNTFDETEYKYDICNHVLARDLKDNNWEVSLKKVCDKMCTRNLIVLHEEHSFVLYPDLTVEYDGFKYTVDQTKKIGSYSQFFSISRLGETLLFVSNRYGFWVIWDKQGNVKVGVSVKLAGMVDGLCGYFNGNPKDDKRKPDGSLGRTTVEFGNSWAENDTRVDCEAKACSMHIQNEAWKMCNKVKDQTLAACAKVVDVEKFISRCLETTCACLEASESNDTLQEECRCATLQQFVVDCMQADTSIELTDWRTQQDCPVSCEAPLEHHDCYRRPCELTCETISDTTACPKMETVCFPGCYCPPGHVRKGDTCVKPSTCRDCECNVLPHLQYVTYDEANFTINGNCVYVMSRDAHRGGEEHKFQVLITNAPCENHKEKSCVGKVTILYEGRKIHVLKDNLRNKLKLIVDSEVINDYGEISSWAEIKQTRSKHLKILLRQIQVEVSVYYPSLGVSVKAPSHKYGGKLEGLCGDCNRDADNDMTTSTGKLTKDVEEFGLSWLYDKLPGGQDKETCKQKPEEQCKPLSILDPCLELLDVDKYGLCHPLLDPTMFIEWCKKDICDGNSQQACVAIGAYAKECMSSNICIHWHSNLCPAETCPTDQEYKPCGSSCPKTCDSIKEKENDCVEVPVDGCFCPEGEVMLNNSCVEQRECEVCDEEGHHPDDTWQKDTCTNCTCVGTSMKCETKHCPAVGTICEDGLDAVKVASNVNECCEKYICVPVNISGPTCEPPQQLQCSSDQIMKLIKKSDGCQKFVCECKPPEECAVPDTSTDKPIEDGMQKVLDNSGCCPVMKLECKKELCRSAPDCPMYYTVQKTENPDKCCPTYKCEAPDECIVDLLYIASEKGGERLRSDFEKQKLLKKVGETWKDGPCRSCSCYGSDVEGYNSRCMVSDCLALNDSPDLDNFVLEYEPVVEQCCPLIKRTACIYKGKVYKVGEKWPVEGDYCTVMECTNTTTGLQKLTEITTCDVKCELGYEYFPASPESKLCCGTCKPAACVVDGEIRNINERWTSTDFCNKYVCLNLNGSLQIQATVMDCATISPELLNEFVYESHSIDNECCKKHKPVACRVGKEIYKVGETWQSPDFDKCKKVTCVENNLAELVKQESVETCQKDCPKGSEYKESEMTCCGECIPVACVVGDELKKSGENWTSADTCTLYSCEQQGDQFTVVSQQESCPSILDCPPENVYAKGCCKHCNMTMKDQKMCSPEEIHPEKTIGLVKVIKAGKGICTNKAPLNGFTECVGSCHSSTFYNSKTASFDSVCTCCRATEHKPMIAELVCMDRTSFQKQVSVPSACSCEGCAEEQFGKLKAPTKSFTKTG